MKRGIVIACLIGLVAAVGARAQDEPPANPPGGHRSMRGGMDSLLPPRLLEKLALAADQKTKYDTLNAGYKKDLAKLESSHSSSNESSTSTNSTSSASSNTGPMANRKAIHQLRKSYMDQLRPSLTSEQITTLDNAAENLHNRSSHGGTNSPPKSSTPPSDNS